MTRDECYQKVERCLIEQSEAALIDLEDALRHRGCTDEEIIEFRDGYWRREGIARRDVLAQARRLIEVVDFDDLSAPSSVVLQ